MATDNSQTSFRRGVMSLVILTLLKREDMYGVSAGTRNIQNQRWKAYHPGRFSLPRALQAGGSRIDL